MLQIFRVKRAKDVGVKLVAESVPMSMKLWSCSECFDNLEYSKVYSLWQNTDAWGCQHLTYLEAWDMQTLITFHISLEN